MILYFLTNIYIKTYHRGGLRAGAASDYGRPCAPTGTLDSRFSLSAESNPLAPLITT